MSEQTERLKALLDDPGFLDRLIKESTEAERVWEICGKRAVIETARWAITEWLAAWPSTVASKKPATESAARPEGYWPELLTSFIEAARERVSREVFTAAVEHALEGFFVGDQVVSAFNFQASGKVIAANPLTIQWENGSVGVGLDHVVILREIPRPDKQIGRIGKDREES